MFRNIRQHVWIKLVFAGLFILPTVHAAEAEETLTPEFGGQWIWALFSLGFVVFLAYYLTRFVAGKFKDGPQAKYIKVAESLSLGTNRHLYLLLVNNQVLLVGDSDRGLNLIKEYDDPNFYESLNLMTASDTRFSSVKFSDLLQRMSQTEDSGEIPLVTGRERILQGLDRLREWNRRK